MSEVFVDHQSVQMSPPDTWSTLSLNNLLETKNQLLNKIHMAKGNQVYLKPLGAALERLEIIIATKLADPRGSN